MGTCYRGVGHLLMGSFMDYTVTFWGCEAPAHGISEWAVKDILKACEIWFRPFKDIQKQLLLQAPHAPPL